MGGRYSLGLPACHRAFAPAPRLQAMKDYLKKLTRRYRNTHNARISFAFRLWSSFIELRFFRTPASAFAGLSDCARPRN
jgi:hypothetical protein